MAVGGWWIDTFGALNVYGRENDSARYFVIVCGVPIFWRFRGCWHEIETGKIKDTERLSRLRGLANALMIEHGPLVEGNTFRIPLKSRWGMRLMASFYWITGLTGIWALGGGIILHLKFTRQGVPPRPNAVAIGALGIAIFIPLLALYRYVRAASRYQAAIRSVVASVLGPFSDPAGWKPEIARSAAAMMGLGDLSPAGLLGVAESKLVAGDPAVALVVARLSLCLVEGANPPLPEEDAAQALSKRCLG